jgi:hypothetical protein
MWQLSKGSSDGRSSSAIQGSPGFALILSILALLLLTFLGLTLATTTSTELQIASNYRWSQQALYNAEAGIEAGKFILKTIPTDWTKVLPPARPGCDFGAGAGCWPADSSLHPGLPAAPWNGNDAFGNPARNWEDQACDNQTGEGLGAVLNDALAVPLIPPYLPQGPAQNMTAPFGQALNGAFTLWVRRDIQTYNGVVVPQVGWLQDDPTPQPTTLVLTAEGTAPFVGGANQAFTAANRAVQYLQVFLQRAPQAPGCGGKNSGQKGGAPSGANFSTCGRLGPGSLAAFAGMAGAGNLADTGVN